MHRQIPFDGCASRLAASFVLLLSFHVMADEAWRGEKVIPRTQSIDILSGSEVIGKTQSYLLTVLSVEGDWLEVRDYGVEGWIAKTDVVLLDNAIEHFTQEIKNNPRDAEAYLNRSIALLSNNSDEAALQDLKGAVGLVTSHFI